MNSGWLERTDIILSCLYFRFILGSNGYNKSSTFIDCPFELKIKQDDGKEFTYDLVALVSHYGSLETGHYTASCKRNGRYVVFFDTMN